MEAYEQDKTSAWQWISEQTSEEGEDDDAGAAIHGSQQAAGTGLDSGGFWS